MSRRSTVLITGANRGIGLALTQQFLAKGWDVVATARHPDGARELWEAERDYGERCRIVEMDVTCDADLDRVAKQLAGKPLDLLINNAGVLTDRAESLEQVTVDSMLKSFTVNTLGPLRVMQKFLANLQAGDSPKVGTITSKMGSVGDNTSGGYYAYRASKVAVNMVNKSFACDYPGIIAVVIHPGWVQTAMGGAGAPVTAEEAAAGICNVLLGLSSESSGRFYDYKGKEIPW